MQITLDEKSLAMLATAISSLLAATWYVSRANSKLEKVDQIEKAVKEIQGIIGPMSVRFGQVWSYLGFSERRLKAQRVPIRGVVAEEMAVELVPPDGPPPPPSKHRPKYQELIGPDDPIRHHASQDPPPHPTTTRVRTWPGQPIKREEETPPSSDEDDDGSR